MQCRFEIRCRAHGAADVVRLFVEDEPAIEEPFDLRALSDNASASVLEDIQYGAVRAIPQLKNIGSKIWNALRPPKIRKRMEALAPPFVVAIDVGRDALSRDLPFETIFDDDARCFLATEERFAVTRVVHAARTFGINQAAASGPIRILVIIPENSRLDVAKEYAGLTRATSGMGERVLVERLDGTVTIDRLRDTIHGRKPWDIVHFIGHSRFTEGTGVQIRINAAPEQDIADGETWIDAGRFSRLFTGTYIRLAVFNSCESASAASALIAGLGEEMASKGVPATVGMRYTILDDISARFSVEFYRALLSRTSPADVVAAMQSARSALYMNADDTELRSFITPVLYVVPGERRIFPESRLSEEPPEKRADEEGVVIPIRVPRKPQHFDDLLTALRKRRCLPVIGPAIHDAAARDALPVQRPSLMRLIESVARDSEYADPDELRLAETLEMVRGLVMSRVFQHYLDSHMRAELVDKLVELCGSVRPPTALEQIASWPVPGIVYTHFDGAMEAAFASRSLRYRLVKSAHEGLANSADLEDRADLPPLLVTLRGTINYPGTLILTDRDHDRLIENLVQAADEVVALFNGALGRTVVFIGVSPADPVVRRIARLFLVADEQGSDSSLQRSADRLRQSVIPQGPRFFITDRVSPSDRAYWSQYKVRWIEEDPVAVINLLSSEVAKG